MLTRDSETRQDSVGLLGMKSFLCPPLLDLPRIPKGRSGKLLIREGRGRRDKEGAAKSSCAAWGQGSGSASRIHSHVFEFLTELKPQQMKTLA